MNRRGFIGALLAAAADPERLLWVPGRKKIFIPPPRRIAGFVLNRSGIEINRGSHVGSWTIVNVGHDALTTERTARMDMLWELRRIVPSCFGQIVLE